MNSVFLYTLVSLGSISFVLGASLAYASKKFAVDVNPLVEDVLDILPGANCGGCGFAGCAAYAVEVVTKGVSATLCAPGGQGVIQDIAKILGLEESSAVKKIAYLHCAGTKDNAKDQYVYDGIKDCRVASLLAGGQKACSYGCVGHGSCVNVCQFDALVMSDNGLPVVDREKCTACGACVRECPKGIFELLPESTKIYLACSSHDKAKAVKSVCSVGCFGCGICAKVAENDVIVMEDNLPKVDYNASESLILAHYKCPTKSYIDLAVKRPYMIIDSSICKGHGKCAEVCPVKGCVTGEPESIHRIEKEKCIGCGLCVEVCPQKAVRVVGAMGYVNQDMSQ